MDDCLFCKMVQGTIPIKKAYEDNEILAFYDIKPKAPVHLLLIPKRHIDSLFEVSAQDNIMLGNLLVLAPRLAQAHNLEAGFKIAVNTGVAGGQEICHLHIHLYGSPK